MDISHYGIWTTLSTPSYQKVARPPRKIKKRTPLVLPFVRKTYQIVEKNNDIIRWDGEGRAILVVDRGQFAKKLLPSIFRHSTYGSFIRMANMYGFQKSNTVDGFDSFFHPFFKQNGM
eukprot:TRINITY_DN20200_c0_g1_i1.p1 TRINITY_DN20200_c0_g1~~TRINITY_DN20200_c0_g1_i1.p1  ORF type:complete len:118 (-),score=6.63 TRINITY_DN20200_c0_g1_i1:278-631(-)